MRLSAAWLLGLLPAALSISTSVTFVVPMTNQLNPWALAPSTHATLSALHSAFSVPLSSVNTFVFRNVTPGSYLVDVHCPTHGFQPLRLDVGEDLVAMAWETYRGNDWDNKGSVVPLAEYDGHKGFEVRVLGQKSYFVERGKFSILSILKSPMILLGLISMAIFIGMPYLVENMDPEMRAEFEERQKSNPMNSLLSGAQPGGQGPMGDFDMAAFLAGSNKKEASGSGGSSTPREKGGRR